MDKDTPYRFCKILSDRILSHKLDIDLPHRRPFLIGRKVLLVSDALLHIVKYRGIRMYRSRNCSVRQLTLFHGIAKVYDFTQ